MCCSVGRHGQFQDGYVNGAGYTDVHARLPAQALLIIISIFAARSCCSTSAAKVWTLPILAVGIWAFVALVVGVIYGTLSKHSRSTPPRAHSRRRISRGCQFNATRAAYNLNGIQTKNFPASTSVTAQQVNQSGATFNNVDSGTRTTQSRCRPCNASKTSASYYTFQQLGVDRYTVDGQLTPVLIGVRKISESGLRRPRGPTPFYLVYTHGNGAVVDLANQTQSNGGPVYGISDIPPTSVKGLPEITQPGVYFALGQSGYVVANTKQLEVDYQKGDNASVESHYKGSGGVQLSSFLKRAAFAFRLGDFNLLISDQITSKSRLMFVRDPVQMAEKAAPFLSFDNDPYSVVNNGHIDWVLDAYTTTNEYPYSQNADTQQVAVGSGLPSSYNYVRNSVKVVIDAYSGKMTFYNADPSDPILKAYEAAFPHMFTPISKMSAELQAHLRYPEDIFSIQSAVYGRYHLITPTAFYNDNGAWQLSPTAGAGPQSQALSVVNTYNSQGQLVSTNPARMSPLYQVEAFPGSQSQAFTITDAFVPATQSNSTAAGNLNLSAFMMGNSDPGRYGKLTVYQTPQGTTGPANADSYIQSNSTVSKDITLLDQKGSEVLLGNTLMVPVGNAMVYLRPLYVASSTNPLPQLTYVIGVVGQRVVIDSSLAQTLTDVLQTTVQTQSGTGNAAAGGGGGTTTAPGTLPSQVQQYLDSAREFLPDGPECAEGRRPWLVREQYCGDGAADCPGRTGAEIRRPRRRQRPRPRRRPRPKRPRPQALHRRALNRRPRPRRPPWQPPRGRKRVPARREMLVAVQRDERMS